MRFSTALILVAPLAACMNTAEVIDPSPTRNALNSTDLAGQSVDSDLAYAFLDLDDAFGNTTGLQLTFDTTGGLVAILNGTPVSLTWDEAAAAYIGTVSGNAVRIQAFANPATPDVITFKLWVDESDPITGDTIITGYAIGGTLTAGADLPSAGSATYTGGVEMTDHLRNTASGTVTINVDLAGSDLSGVLTVESGLVIGAATFTFAAPLQRGAEDATFQSAVFSDDVSITSGQVDGAFLGSAGDQIAGVVSITTSTAGVSGVFTAHD